MVWHRAEVITGQRLSQWTEKSGSKANKYLYKDVQL